jgi:hypothetical protein
MNLGQLAMPAVKALATASFMFSCGGCTWQ